MENKELKQKIVDFLTEMSSQNNRMTGFPYYFTIADEKERYEFDGSGDCICYDGSMIEIKDYIKKNYSAEECDFENMDDSDIDEFIENEFDGNDEFYGRFRKELDTYYEGVFLTEKDAEVYLESASNHHFGPNPRTFVLPMAFWGRHTLTEDFFKDLFNFFDVKIPPELYYENKKQLEEQKID